MNIFTNVTKTLFTFFEALGYEVYLTDSIKEGAIFPYISIDYQIDDFGEDGLIQGKIWSKSSSRAEVNEVSDKLINEINKGITIKIQNENGYIYLRQGSPFIQAISDIEGLQVNYFNIIIQVYY